MSENFLERLNELPENLSEHLRITIIALLAGVLISVPTAIALTRRPKYQYPALTTAGVIQTIPSLALLALMVPLLAKTDGFWIGIDAFGFYPAVIALTLYSILPILRNTVTGLTGVDAAMIEAARGVGMTERQALLRVQLPLAAPVIIAGIRTATVWIVGIATLATPVGQRCLGNYIFTGLQTRNWTMVMFGVVGAAGLAVLLDLLIGGLQRAAETRSRALGMFAGGALVAVIVGGLLSPALVDAVRRSPDATKRIDAEGERDPRIRDNLGVVHIGAKTFTEQYILVELIAQRLVDAGIPVERSVGLGSTMAFDALVNGNIDLYVDYSGTIWANHMKRDATAAPWVVLAEMNAYLAAEHEIRSLGSLGFENAYALAMRRSQAQDLGVQSIADLAAHAGAMRVGGDYEFFGRPEWTQIRDAYGLRFDEQVSYDSTLMYEAVANGEVDVISAFSSDGRIAAYDLVTLEDPQQVIPPYDAVVLLGPRIANESLVVEALRPLIESIDVEEMRRANLQVDRDDDKRTPAQAAGWLHERIRDGG
ncbi:MAG: ABC transporter permease/substrate-binding protein [Phycisphaerales bacterium]